MVFSLARLLSKEWYGDPYTLPPAVQFPPYSAPYLLAVKAPTGDCLNLRENHAVGARPIRCLPDGTPLAISEAARVQGKGGPLWGTTPGENDPWLFVRTRAGSR